MKIPTSVKRKNRAIQGAQENADYFRIPTGGPLCKWCSQTKAEHVMGFECAPTKHKPFNSHFTPEPPPYQVMKVTITLRVPQGLTYATIAHRIQRDVELYTGWSVNAISAEEGTK
jgi:hypothetical protein